MIENFTWEGRNLVGLRDDDITYKYNDQGIRTEKKQTGSLRNISLTGIA
ncbi:MAG: hypothetical protein WBK54_00615 [Bacilli bacterium]|nr:hypothetical protein [Acholeplasmataceae bacterium]